MDSIIEHLLQQYGIYGILIVLIGYLSFLIISDRKNQWEVKIDKLFGKIDNIDLKIEMVEEKMTSRIDMVEEKMGRLHTEERASEIQAVQEQTNKLISEGWSGKLSRILRKHCSLINADHVFLASFHNGTIDVRGVHYCKFDIIIDEYKDPLNLQPNDTDFQSLYKDENLVAYGDLPMTMSRVDANIFPVDGRLLDLSNTLYRSCKCRGIQSIGFAIFRDDDGNAIGYVGAVSYTDQPMDIDNLKTCVKEVEKLYND